MLMTVFESAPVLAGINLTLSALSLLIFGVFHNKKQPAVHTLRLTSLGAVLSIGLAILALLGEGSTSSSSLAGIVKILDNPYTRLVIGLAYFSAMCTLYGTYRYLQLEGVVQFEYPILILLSLVGVTLYVTANDFLYFFMGIELHSLAIYVMAAMNRHDNRSSEGAIKYFILGIVSTVFILYGASFIYGYTGTTHFAVIAEQLNQFDQAPLAVILGLVLIIAGLAFKVSAVPFHMWAPDVYEGAPTPVVAFVATVPKIAAMTFIVRLLYGPFGQFINEWQMIGQILAILSISLGVLAALYQKNLKRLLAYSGISHTGYMLLGASCASVKSVQSILVYLVLYTFMAIGVFLALTHLRRNGKSPVNVEDLKGLSRTHPLMAFGLAAFMFSLAGIPPFSGFFAKLGVIMAAVDEGLVWLAVFAVLHSVVGAVYYLRVVKVMYFDEPKENEAVYECSNSQETGLVIAICVTITTAYLFLPKAFLFYANQAANTLFLS